MLAPVISIHARTDEQVRVAENAGMAADLLEQVRRIIEGLGTGEYTAWALQSLNDAQWQLMEISRTGSTRP